MNLILNEILGQYCGSRPVIIINHKWSIHTLIPDENSLEFLIEHLKLMIQEQPDKRIEKISDLTDILSDFMSTFLVVVDALISSSQRRFKAMDEKLDDFEDLLLSSSVKGLSQLAEKPHVPQTVEKITSEVQKAAPAPFDKAISSTPSSAQTVPPPPSQEAENEVVVPESPVIPEEKTIEITDDLEVDQLANLAFQQRKQTPSSPRPTPVRPTVSLKMELMQELKKMFGAKILATNK